MPFSCDISVSICSIFENADASLLGVSKNHDSRSSLCRKLCAPTAHPFASYNIHLAKSICPHTIAMGRRSGDRRINPKWKCLVCLNPAPRSLLELVLSLLFVSGHTYSHAIHSNVAHCEALFWSLLAHLLGSRSYVRMFFGLSYVTFRCHDDNCRHKLFLDHFGRRNKTPPSSFYPPFFRHDISPPVISGLDAAVFECSTFKRTHRYSQSNLHRHNSSKGSHFLFWTTTTVVFGLCCLGKMARKESASQDRNSGRLVLSVMSVYGNFPCMKR